MFLEHLQLKTTFRNWRFYSSESYSQTGQLLLQASEQTCCSRFGLWALEDTPSCWAGPSCCWGSDFPVLEVEMGFDLGCTLPLSALRPLPHVCDTPVDDTCKKLVGFIIQIFLLWPRKLWSCACRKLCHIAESGEKWICQITGKCE